MLTSKSVTKPMTNVEIMRYVFRNHRDRAVPDLAADCGCGEDQISEICLKLGLDPIFVTTKKEPVPEKPPKKTRHWREKVAVIKKANGEKTALELAEMIGCTTNCIYKLCRLHWLSYKQDIEEDNTEWSPERKREEAELYIKRQMSLGYSRLEAIEILAETVRMMDRLTETEKTIKRPPAIYANPSREQLIDQILNT